MLPEDLLNSILNNIYNQKDTIYRINKFAHKESKKYLITKFFNAVLNSLFLNNDILNSNPEILWTIISFQIANDKTNKFLSYNNIAQFSNDLIFKSFTFLNQIRPIKEEENNKKFIVIILLKTANNIIKQIENGGKIDDLISSICFNNLPKQNYYYLELFDYAMSYLIKIEGKISVNSILIFSKLFNHFLYYLEFNNNGRNYNVEKSRILLFQGDNNYKQLMNFLLICFGIGSNNLNFNEEDDRCLYDFISGRNLSIFNKHFHCIFSKIIFDFNNFDLQNVIELKLKKNFPISSFSSLDNSNNKKCLVPNLENTLAKFYIKLFEDSIPSIIVTEYNLRPFFSIKNLSFPKTLSNHLVMFAKIYYNIITEITSNTYNIDNIQINILLLQLNFFKINNLIDYMSNFKIEYNFNLLNVTCNKILNERNENRIILADLSNFEHLSSSSKLREMNKKIKKNYKKLIEREDTLLKSKIMESLFLFLNELVKRKFDNNINLIRDFLRTHTNFTFNLLKYYQNNQSERLIAFGLYDIEKLQTSYIINVNLLTCLKDFIDPKLKNTFFENIINYTLYSVEKSINKKVYLNFTSYRQELGKYFKPNAIDKITLINNLIDFIEYSNSNIDNYIRTFGTDSLKIDKVKEYYFEITTRMITDLITIAFDKDFKKYYSSTINSKSKMSNYYNNLAKLGLTKLGENDYLINYSKFCFTYISLISKNFQEFVKYTSINSTQSIINTIISKILENIETLMYIDKNYNLNRNISDIERNGSMELSIQTFNKIITILFYSKSQDLLLEFYKKIFNLILLKQNSDNSLIFNLNISESLFYTLVLIIVYEIINKKDEDASENINKIQILFDLKEQALKNSLNNKRLEGFIIESNIELIQNGVNYLFFKDFPKQVLLIIQSEF